MKAADVTKPKKKSDAKNTGADQEKDKTVSDETTEKAPREQQNAFPIVGIGSSAGGLEALKELFNHMPATMGMSFVVITHQHPGHRSVLTELLARETDMPVTSIEDGMKVEQDVVYVLPPGGNAIIDGGRLRLQKSDSTAGASMPIDRFFRSLAHDQHERAICIVLSGTGSDGTLGIREIKGQGGMAISQEQPSAKYRGMPSSAERTGLVDAILPPARIPAKLSSYVKGPYLKPRKRTVEKETQLNEELIGRMLMLIRSRTGHSFSSYKQSTVKRRIERRMTVHGIKKPEEYLDFLRGDGHEVRMLFSELLITVTSFFRDSDAWETLKERALTDLVQNCGDNHELRVWIPGCATGEEAYSAAILLAEITRDLHKPLDIRVFATDLDTESIEQARRARYPVTIRADVSPERRSRFFTPDGDDILVVRKEIRDMVVFAVQNVASDPPFMRLDLLICRNLLIYLQNDLQNQLLPMFHYSLSPGGILFLGSSESVGSHTDLFEPLDNRWKLFRRRDVPARMPEIETRGTKQTVVRTAHEQPAGAGKGGRQYTGRIVERMLLDRFAPTSIVIDPKGTIVYIHGRSGAYLEPEQQEPRNNVLEMAREGLRGPLATSVHRAREQNDTVHRHAIRVKTNSHFTTVDLTVAPLWEPEPLRGLVLVTITPVHLPEASGKRDGIDHGKKKHPEEPQGRIEDLERELHYARESHQTSLEELQTTNEELQSSNEELQSTNEELQSSKEEMESLNEELSTVNNELNSKVESLARAEDDMKNLLNSTDLAVIFVDNQLRVKRYTERVRDLVKLRESDIGRPLGDLSLRLQYDGLLDDCRTVLDKLMRKEKEIISHDGNWLLMRILPYRTSENVIGGVVVTFVEITRLKKAEEIGDYFESMVRTIPHPLVVLTADFRVRSANRAFYRTFDSRPEKVEGRLLYELDHGQWDIPELHTLLESILPKHTEFEDYVVEHDFPRIGHRKFILNARQIRHTDGMEELILLALEEAE